MLGARAGLPIFSFPYHSFRLGEKLYHVVCRRGRWHLVISLDRRLPGFPDFLDVRVESEGGGNLEPVRSGGEIAGAIRRLKYPRHEDRMPRSGVVLFISVVLTLLAAVGVNSGWSVLFLVPTLYGAGVTAAGALSLRASERQLKGGFPASAEPDQAGD